MALSIGYVIYYFRIFINSISLFLRQSYSESYRRLSTLPKLPISATSTDVTDLVTLPTLPMFTELTNGIKSPNRCTRLMFFASVHEAYSRSLNQSKSIG
jgi:hypothetical protein